MTTTKNEYEITRRGYDGKVMVWASTDSGQQCIGVFDDEVQASRFLDDFNSRRSTKSISVDTNRF